MARKVATTIASTAFAAVALASLDANALSVRITDSTDGIFGNADDVFVVITDGGIGDFDVTGGGIVAIESVGDFEVRVTAQTVTDGASFSVLTHNVVVSQPTGRTDATSKLRVESTEANIALGDGNLAAEYAINGTLFSGNDAGNVVGSGSINGSNTEFALENLIGDASLLINAANKAKQASEAIGTLNPFSLTLSDDITHFEDSRPTNFDASIDISAVAVPVPGALPLFASAMLGLGLLSRRRSRS